ncbi:MAG: VWA domain-containing protein [Deltaproteobacteria bacterium]|nr:VWA domain-containing protein [Deltaproteobacteria bacterium]
MSTTLRMILIPLALVALLAAAASAQPAEEESQGAFFDKVSVDIVNVEVFVTNKKDEPVTGLTAEDFSLLVDGKPTPLTNFYAEAGGQVVTLRSRDEGTGEEEGPASPAVGAPIVEERPEAQRLHLMIFVDNRNMRAANRKKSFKYLRQFLASQLDPEDLVAVASLDTSLVFRSDFLKNRDFLGRILDEVEKGGAGEAGLSLERQQIFNDLATGDGFTGNDREILSRIQVAAQTQFNAGKASVAALGAVINSLAGIRGRKAILQISDGISTNPGEAMYEAWSNRFGPQGDYTSAIGAYDLLPDFQELGRRANAAQVTFYTLDAESNHRSFGRSAAYTGGLENVITSTVLETSESNNRAPLELAAIDTGGRRIEASGRLSQQLSKIGNDFATFYSLGFRAPEASSREKHRIEVKVAGKGLRVRHREAYEDKGEDRRSGEAVIAALLYNSIDSALGVSLEPLASRSGENDTRVLPVRIKIPISQVAFLPQGEQHNAQLSFFVTVKDKKGNVRPVQKIPFKLRIPADKFDEAQSRTADYELPVVLQAGDQQVAIAVRDDIGGIGSTRRLEL